MSRTYKDIFKVLSSQVTDDLTFYANTLGFLYSASAGAWQQMATPLPVPGNAAHCSTATTADGTTYIVMAGGFNYTDPDIDDPRVDPDFGLEFLILGASFYTTPESFAYIEALLSSATDADGGNVDSVISTDSSRVSASAFLGSMGE